MPGQFFLPGPTLLGHGPLHKGVAHPAQLPQRMPVLPIPLRFLNQLSGYQHPMEPILRIHHEQVRHSLGQILRLFFQKHRHRHHPVVPPIGRHRAEVPAQTGIESQKIHRGKGDFLLPALVLGVFVGQLVHRPILLRSGIALHRKSRSPIRPGGGIVHPEGKGPGFQRRRGHQVRRKTL